MHHVPSPVLRRLVDEPLAVPDLARRHIAGCGRCRAESTEIAADAALAARVLGAPSEVADIDLEWILLQDRLTRPAAAKRPVMSRPGRMPRRLANISVGAGTAVVAGVLATGAAAAAVLTTVYAPTQVAPVRISANDLQAIESITGIGRLSGGPQPSGSTRLAFGDLTWTTAGRAQQVSSLASASAMTHLTFPDSGDAAVGRGGDQPHRGRAPGDSDHAVQPERRPCRGRKHSGDHRRPCDRRPVRRHVRPQRPDHARDRRHPQAGGVIGRRQRQPARGVPAAPGPACLLAWLRNCGCSAAPRCRCRSRPGCRSCWSTSAGRRRCSSPTPTALRPG